MIEQAQELIETYQEAFKLAYSGFDYHYLRNLHSDYNSQIDANAIHDAFLFRRTVLKTHNYPKQLNQFPLLRTQDYHIEGERVSVIYKPRQRLVLRIYPSEKQLNLMKQDKVKGARLVEKDGKYFFNVTVEKEVQLPDPSECETFIGVDIGINYLTACSTFDGKKFGNPLFFGGGEWKNLCDRKRKVLTKSEEFKHLTRKQHEILHTVAKRIVEYAKRFPKPIIVLERLGHFSNGTKNHRFNFLLGNWARRKLQEFIEYKAKWEGIPVYYVNPAYTSQTCCYCGARGERNGKHFYCPNCKRTLNADFNASVNIARTAFRRAKSDDREAFLAGSNACGEGETCLPVHTHTQPSGRQMNGMMVARTVSLPMAVGGGERSGAEGHLREVGERVKFVGEKEYTISGLCEKCQREVFER